MLQNLIDRFLEKNRNRKLNVHCLGDSMIDEYANVSVNRISPEAPMSIFLANSDEYIQKPGGAANTVYQLSNFNTNSILVSFSDDLSVKVWTEHGIPLYCLGLEAKLPIKRRFLDKGIQVARHDIEVVNCGIKEELLESVPKLVKNSIDVYGNPDIVICSDYNKGFFYNTEKLFSNYTNSIIIVDPKKGPLKKWQGCHVFKPNVVEAYELSGETNWKIQSKYFQKELSCKSVVITDGGSKVCGISDNEHFCYIPDKKVNVESTIGAGDAFCAIFALAIGHGFTANESAEIAWNAGAIYVQNKMNRPIVPAELSLNKIVHPLDLAKRDFKLTFTNGCFDAGLTKGHVELLKFAKSQGNKVVVALNSDSSVKSLNKGGNRPVLNLDERMTILGALECVDFVVSFDESTPLRLIEQISPEIIVKGGDYKKEEVVGYGLAEVKICPYISCVSTTDKIKNVIFGGSAKIE